MVLQAIISVLIILLVLIQFGKGAEAGLIGGTSDSVFSGAQQGNILTKITTILAIIFMGNSIYLAKVQSSSANKSLLDNEVVTRPLNSDKADKKDTATTPPTAETEKTNNAKTTDKK
ncbi:MAG: preprotein translocase subunit SecG [Bdellovibrionales bacterium RIFOXYC2_FULL_39_8]|nr:MAG: preprotein translocase subunit SecG [Bdellovibrionales bacterium RIFOXYC2_FULL_39_8]